MKRGGLVAKIKNDKYYTSPKLAKYIVNKTKEIIGEKNITEYLEPSAGQGVFLDYLDKPYLAYDIEPEDDRIVQQDFLELELEYKKGRCIIGNPPFGRGNTLAVRFYKKSIQIADYIAFILPISQLNNNMQMYEFDLVYSEDLKEQSYSDRKLHCCLNIYRRPKNNVLNKKPNYKLKDVEIKEYRRNEKNLEGFKFDIGICVLGRGMVGKEPQYIGQYAKEMYFKIHNSTLKSQVIKLIRETDWENILCGNISGQLSLPQWRIYKYLKEQIPELE
jgi:hypothetical protein